MWVGLPLGALLLASLSSAMTRAEAAEIRVHPAGEAGSGGSAGSDLFREGRVRAGDRIILEDGIYGQLDLPGDLVVGGGPDAPPVTVAPAMGAAPRLSALRVSGRARWRIEGLTLGPAGDATAGPYILSGPETSGIVFDDIRIVGAPPGAKWTAQNRKRLSRDGAQLMGSAHAIEGGHFTDIRHGVEIDSPATSVRGLTIDGFSGDGIRITANDALIDGTEIRNCYRVDGNHDDGIQAWSVGKEGAGTGVIRGGTLRRNRIVWQDDPSRGFGCRLQGIGLFDGIYDDWTIENNLVLANHWHGITVMGARDVRIVANTVVDPTGEAEAWITVTQHKDGRPSEGGLIAGNIASSLNEGGFGRQRYATAAGTRVVDNVIVTDPSDVFADPAAGDWSPRADGPAIDAGYSGGPRGDLNGRRRTTPPDAGAIEG